jgi:hypothetical protein
MQHLFIIEFIYIFQSFTTSFELGLRKKQSRIIIDVKQRAC